MNHNDKIALAISDLTARGVGKGSIAPPAFRLAWKLGIELPPPHFLSFGQMVAVMGTFFGVLWGVLMWFVVWSRQGIPTGVVIGAALGAGLLFGVLMALYYRWRSRPLQLPAWKDYPGKS